MIALLCMSGELLLTRFSMRLQRKGGIVSDIGVYAGFCSHFNIGYDPP